MMHPGPLLGRPSLQALAGEVQIAFADAARAEAARRGEPPSLEGLRSLREVLVLQERLLSRGADDPLLPILPPEVSDWFDRHFWWRDARERALMTAVASKMLSLPYLRRDAEEALGLEGPVSLPARIAAILGSFALYIALPCAPFAPFVVSPTLLDGSTPLLLAAALLWSAAVAANVPLLGFTSSLGLWDFRPGRAGRYVVPALLAAGLFLWFAVDVGLLPTLGPRP